MTSEVRVLDHTSKVLKGNPLNDPFKRKVLVYLPPSYNNGNKKYPVMYLIAGFTGYGALNMNIPNIPTKDIKGVKITKQGKSYWEDGFEVRKDPHGKEYYWLTGKMVYRDDSNEFDVAAVKDNYISITPLHFDLTDYRTFEEIKDWKINL